MKVLLRLLEQREEEVVVRMLPAFLGRSRGGKGSWGAPGGPDLRLSLLSTRSFLCFVCLDIDIHAQQGFSKALLEKLGPKGKCGSATELWLSSPCSL